MADPLSISASIAGLVSLADVVFTRTYRYVRAVKKASSEISALSSEIGSLYGVLCSIQSISRQLEGEIFEAATRIHHIHACQKTLEEVKTILDRDRRSSSQDEPWETLKKKLHWPFKSSEVKSLMSDIGRHKSTLNLALEVDGIAGLLQVLSGQQNLESGMNGIKQELRLKRELDTKVILNEENARILETFGRVDYRRSHDTNRRLRHPGTGTWLVESPTFRDWVRSENCCLWLYGIPGAGKTVLASLAIDEALRQYKPGQALVYFYCDYKDSKTQEPQCVLGSLAQQIAKQDERCFEKLRKFHDEHGPGQKDTVIYEPELLQELIGDMISAFENTTIIVDALDECLGHVGEVIELLIGLHKAAGDNLVKLLLFSRDEIEIRQLLEGSPQISIAAENSDLRLYVGAEIEDRVRKKKLNIKNPSLKEHIVERLINGAEGMFRWVTCQMDYLCELPHDAARRKALDNLPRGLTPTYERILRRINGSDVEVQKLARRAFQWLYFADYGVDCKSLCQAVAIELSDSCINHEAIPDDVEILRYCSSLIRRSADGYFLEFAHFTVKEFLSRLENEEGNEFTAYAMNSDIVKQDLAKVCLTYITMTDFEYCREVTEEAYETGTTDCPFLLYADYEWHHLIQDWDDTELIELLKKFFNPSKTGALVSWAQRLMYPRWIETSEFSKILEKIAAGAKEATALHFASMICIPEICKWLIESGIDPNSPSVFGSPLQCAIITVSGYYDGGIWQLEHEYFSHIQPSGSNKQLTTVDVLLAAGSDPTALLITGEGALSTMTLALRTQKPVELAVQLLQKGASFNKQDIDRLCEICSNEDAENILSVVRTMSENDLIDTSQDIILRRALMAASKGGEKDLGVLLPKKFEHQESTSTEMKELEMSMRIAAEYGQLRLMVQLLDTCAIFIDAACPETGMTAIHHAAANDHLDILNILLARGANLAKTDNLNRSAVHYSIRASGHRCLQFLLGQDLDVNIWDDNGNTAWHETILNDNKKALQILASSHQYQYFPTQESTSLQTWRSPLSLAAEKPVSVDFLCLLLSAGCRVQDVDTEGYTAFHYAAKSCSVSKMRFLIENGADMLARSLDGSSPLHLAVRSESRNCHEGISYLVENGSDPFLANNDMLTPVDIWIEQYSEEPDFGRTVNTLQVLVQRKESDPLLQESLINLCLLTSPDTSHFLSIALETLLQNGAKLTTKDNAGKTAFSLLLKTWLIECSALETKRIKELRLDDCGQAQIIHIALDHMPIEAIKCSYRYLPDLLIWALALNDEDLAKKVLAFSPDVDCAPIHGDAQSCATESAIANGCSDSLFKDILALSRAMTDQDVAANLYKAAVRKDQLRFAEIMFRSGLGFNVSGFTPLMIAAIWNRAEMARWLLDHGANVNSVDEDAWNAAHHACAHGSVDILHVLRSTDINWSARAHPRYEDIDFSDATVLHMAAFYGRKKVLEYLIDNGLSDDLDCVTNDGYTPLYLAVWEGHAETVAWLLSRDVSLTKMAFGESPLHLCVEFGYDKILGLFESRKCDFTATNREGLDCEMIAWKHGHRELAERIRRAKGNAGKTEHGPCLSPVLPPKQSLRALKVGIELGDTTLCARAIDEGAGLESILPGTNGRTPVSYCAELGQPEIAHLLVTRGLSSIHVKHDMTLFHYAIIWKRMELLRLLLQKHSSSLFLKKAWGHPIHTAIWEGAPEYLSVMLNHTYPTCSSYPTSLSGTLDRANFARESTRRKTSIPDIGPASEYLANITAGPTLDPGWLNPNIRGTYRDEMISFTPLHFAVQYLQHDCARILLAAGSHVNAFNSQYQTALHLASANGDRAMAELLLEAGAQVQVRDSWLMTPPMIAARNGHLSVLKLLLKRPIDLEACSCYRDTILHMAAQSGRMESFAYIFNKAHDVVDLERRCGRGFSVLCWAFLSARSGRSFLLNLAPNSQTYMDDGNNVLSAAIGNRHMTVQHIKMLLRRIPSELLKSILGNGASDIGTPLYVACTGTHVASANEIINLLLDAGAAIDQDGGYYGSPLIAACTLGRLFAVKILIRRGAKPTFTKYGKTRSPLIAAKNFPGITGWLLIGRFKDGPLSLT